MQSIDLMSSWIHLRKLQLHALDNFSPTYAKRLAAGLSNLEELHFSAINMASSFQVFFHPFCKNPNLKTLVINSDRIYYKCTRTDIVNINKVRESLESSAALTIFMNKKVIDAISFTIPENAKVFLKPLSELPREIHAFN